MLSGYGLGYGIGMFMRLIPSFVFLIFIVVFVTIIMQAVRGTRQWSKNNNSPVLSVEAIVVSKRQNTSISSMGTDQMQHTSHTTYYITFEVESGDRMEFTVKGTTYGMIVENDCGKLTFQGTRFLDFQRSM